jgi:hypothetical protein
MINKENKMNHALLLQTTVKDFRRLYKTTAPEKLIIEFVIIKSVHNSNQNEFLKGKLKEYNLKYFLSLTEKMLSQMPQMTQKMVKKAILLQERIQNEDIQLISKLNPNKLIPLLTVEKVEDLDVILSRSINHSLKYSEYRSEILLKYRMGLGGQPIKTLEEISSKYLNGVTRQAVNGANNKVKKDFIESLKIDKEDIWALVKSELNTNLVNKMPLTSGVFYNNSLFLSFLEYVCGQCRGSFNDIIYPKLDKGFIGLFFSLNRDTCVNELSKEIQVKYNYSKTQAANVILDLIHKKEIILDEDKVFPINLIIKSALCHASLFFPDGVSIEEISDFIELKGFCNEKYIKQLKSYSWGSFVDRDVLYLYGKSTYRHISFFNISNADIDNILDLVEKEFRKKISKGSEGVDLKSSILNGLKIDFNYFDIRYIISKYGQKKKINLQLRSNMDQVCLDKDYSTEHIKKSLMILFKSKKSKLTYTLDDIENHIHVHNRIKSKAYIEQLIQEKLIVKVDRLKYTTPSIAFEGPHEVDIINIYIKLSEDSMSSFTTVTFRDHCNKSLHITHNKYWYFSFLKYNADKYKLDLSQITFNKRVW